MPKGIGTPLGFPLGSKAFGFSGGIGLGIGDNGAGGGEPPEPTAPANTVAPAITGTVEVGETLSVSKGSWSGYPSPTYTYQWKDDTVNIGGATSSTFLLTMTQLGGNITCEVTATNTEGSDSALSNEVGPVVSIPVNIVAPVISGTLEEGDLLSCTTGTWQGTATITYGYQWKADGTNIGGATSSTFTLTATQGGANMTCLVTATNGVGTASQISNQLGPVVADTVPDAFDAGDWTLTDPAIGGALTVTISALPDDGGSTITDIEYRVDGGSWTSSGENTTGAFNITGLTDDVEYDVELRAVNAVGAGAASDLKSETPTLISIPLRTIGANNTAYAVRDSVSGKNRCGTRYVHIVGADASALVFGTAGWAFDTNEVNLQNNFTILKATLWDPTLTYSAPITWDGGSRSKTVIAGDAIVLSDAIAASALSQTEFVRDAEYIVKVVYSVPNTGDRLPGGNLDNRDRTGQQALWYLNTDIPADLDPDASGGAFPTTSTTSRIVGCQMIMLGYPVVDGPSFITVGDSIAANIGDGTANGAIGRGFVNRAMCQSVGSGASTTPLNSYPNLNFSRSGIGSGSYQAATKWQSWAPLARYAIDELMTNDQTTNTLAQMKTLASAMWTLLTGLGIEGILRTELLLQASSSDNWATTVNQTITTGWENTGKIDSLNQWMATKVGTEIHTFVSGLRTSVADLTDTDKWLPPKVNNNDLTHPSTAGAITLAAGLRSVITSL